MRPTNLWKTIGSAVMVAIIATTMISCQSQENHSKADQASSGEQTLQIGAILPLTGDLAFLGQPEQSALRVAVQEINNAAEDRTYELTVEDSRGQAKTAVSAARKLINTNDIDLGVVSTSSVSNAVAPIFQEAGIPLITHCSDGTIAEQHDKAVNFYVNVHNEQQTMADYMIEQGVSSFSAVRVNAQITQLGIDLLKKYGRGQLEVVNDLAYKLGNANFRNLISKVKSDNSDALYLMGYGTEFPTLVKTIRELNVQKPILGNYTFLSDAARTNPGQLYDGVHFTSFTITPQDVAETDFGKAFTEVNGGSPGPFMDYVFVYEGIKTWNQAIKSGVNPSKFSQHVRGKTYNTLFGEVTIDTTGNAKVPMAIGAYSENGNVTLVDTTVSSTTAMAQ